MAQAQQFGRPDAIARQKTVHTGGIFVAGRATIGY